MGKLQEGNVFVQATGWRCNASNTDSIAVLHSNAELPHQEQEQA